jgi:hypothetical protein
VGIAQRFVGVGVAGHWVVATQRAICLLRIRTV